MSDLTAEWKETLSKLDSDELTGLIISSPAMHFATSVQILNKANELIYPEPNILQLRMSQVYETCQHLGIPCRILVCKPRQVGASTFAAHMGYHHAQRFRVNGITISDVGDNSKKLMRKLGDYSTRDSFPWGNKLEARSDRLDFSNGSHQDIDSAENWKAGIGDTRQLAHFSEVGKWPKSGAKQDKRVMSAVLPSIPKLPGTLVIAESTPDGAVGWFYETWQDALNLDDYLEAREQQKIGDVQWIKVFAAWFEFSEHQRPVSATEVEHIRKTLNDRERSGMRLYGWSWEQIAWRRDIIAAECAGSADVFDEYYPEDDVSCWQASGRPRFNIPALKRQEALARSQNPDTGFVVRQESGDVMLSTVRDGSGDVLFWERPQEGMRYLVVCDPMTGEDQTTGKDPDHHSILVLRGGYWNETTGEDVKPAVVARVRHGFIGDSDEATGHIVRLSLLYGKAMIVLEVNMGLHILALLKLEGLPILQRKVFSERVGTQVKQYGFKLKDKDQRRMLVEALATAIRTEDIVLNSLEAVEECKNFITDASGKDIARGGAKDDDVLALAMGNYSLPSATTYRTFSRRKGAPRDAHTWKTVGDLSY